MDWENTMGRIGRSIIWIVVSQVIEYSQLLKIKMVIFGLVLLKVLLNILREIFILKGSTHEI